VVVLFGATGLVRAVTQTNYGRAGLWMLLRWWKLVLVIACCTAYQFWMQELEIVNQDSSSLEQVIDSRLKAIEQRLFPERFQ
jgi:hypothetical protein